MSPVGSDGGPGRGAPSLERIFDPVTVVLFAVALSAGFATFGSVTALDDVARHFGHVVSGHSIQDVVGLSGSVLGLGLSSLRAASLLALPLASLADRRGRTPVLRRTLVGGLLVTALAALSPAYWFFVACFAVARPLLGAATTLVQVVTVELSARDHRMRLLAVMTAGTAIGSGLSALVHGLIRGPDSFRWLFALALVPLALVVPSTGRLPEPRVRPGEHPMAHLGEVGHEAAGSVVRVAVVAFVIGVATGPAGGFTFVYGEGVLRMLPRSVSLLVVVSGLAGFLGLVVGARLSATLGRRAAVGVGTLVTAVAAAYAYSGGRLAFVVGYVAGVGAGGVLAPSMAALATEVFAHRYRATAAGWIAVAGVAGAVAGFALFGYVSDVVSSGVATGLRIPALVTFLPLLPALWVLRGLPEGRDLELT